MSTRETFSKRLKELRGKIPIKQLSEDTGISTTALYKAESGEDSVAWKTIEAAYGALCKRAGAYEELLCLWAMTQSDRPVTLYKTRMALDEAIMEEKAAATQETGAILRQVELMPVGDQRAFAKFAAHYRRSEHTRRMADVWMDSADGWIREMRG